MEPPSGVVPSAPMIRRLVLPLCLAAALLPRPSAAQLAVPDDMDLFGAGKPSVFKEETMDRRFNKSRLGKMLAAGSDDPNCVEVMGALFLALGEIAPMLHKRDDNFVLDPVLQDALAQQASTPIFPALGYFTAMVRRVRIENRLPDEWFEVAKRINSTVKIVDLAKLKLLTDGVSLIDSAYFSIPVLRQRYYVEVKAANSAVTTDVAGAFRDKYLDRDVAWGGAILLDLGSNAPPPKGQKGKGRQKLRPITPGDMSELVAILEWRPPDPRKTSLDLVGAVREPPPPVRIYAKLAPKQYIDLEKIPRGGRMMVRGRFWEMNQTTTEVEVRDALLFNDRDFGNGVLLAIPEHVQQCSAAINELTGLAPKQPGGFGH